MDNELKGEIIMEVKRIEEDSNYSSKGHFYEGQYWKKLNFRLGIAIAFISAIAGGFAATDLSCKTWLVPLLSVFNAAFMAAVAFMNPGDRSSQHLLSGNKYLDLRNDARIFWRIQIGLLSSEKINDAFNLLKQRRTELNSSSPQVSEKSFNEGKNRIEKGETTYEMDQGKQ